MRSRSSAGNPSKSGNRRRNSSLVVSPSIVTPSYRSEIAMDEVNRHGALAGRRCDAPHGVVPDIAGHEDPGHIGLQEIWRTVKLPAGRRLAILHQIGAREDELRGI